jgi:DNA (cytosine-5)-methyltransferase 1
MMLDLDDFRARTDQEPLIIDSFAGGGGASTGIEMALGRSPDIAINHNADALAMHAVNHPDTLHVSENVYHVDPLDYLRGRHVGLAWFSPDCKHFSKAKGGTPVQRNIRDLAWIIPGWIERIQNSGGKVDVVILENVEEFRTWGPLVEGAKGLMPCPDRRGQTFEKWCAALKKLGGRIEYRELRACDYGAPTIRKRLFVIVRFDGKKIVWPARTHGDPKKPEDAALIASGVLKPYRTAAEIIDWSLPCPSIFDTSAEIMEKFGVRAIRPLADATMKRIARGVVRYVLEADMPYVVEFGRRYEREDGTLSTPFAVRTDMASAADRNGVNTLEEPMRTQTTAGSHAVVVPSFVGCGGRAGQSAPRAGDDPLGTQTAKADGCLVAPYLVPRYQEREGQQPRVRSVDEPSATIVPGGNEGVLAAVHLTKFQSNATGSSMDDPAPTITANSYVKRPGGAAPIGVVAAHLSRFTQNGIGQDAQEPLDTVMAGAPKFGVVAAFLAQHNNDSRRIGGVNPGRPAEEPLATLTASGAQQQVVAAHMMRQFGTSIGHDLDEPSHTDTATVNKSALISGFLTKYYGTGDGAELGGPVHTDTTKDRFGLVTVDIDGATYAIADIGMRMLTPRERFRAQGFPDSYIIDRRADGTPITATVQGSCCGNSVCPPLAEALVTANCGHLSRYREAAE